MTAPLLHDEIPAYLQRLARLYEEGQSTEAIAKALHLPKQTVWVYVARARKLGLIHRRPPAGSRPGRRHVCKGCGAVGHTRRGCKVTRGGLRA